MPQKRKHSTSIASPQKPKFAKTTEESQKRFKTAAKPAVADEEESSNGEDVFEGFGSDDQEESESEDEESSEESEEEDSDESMEEEEDDEDELDNDDEDEEQEEMDVDETVDGTEENRKQISKTSSIKEVPAHAAQRALAKERKLSRPNGNIPTFSHKLIPAQKLSEAKKIWESLRQQKGLSKKDREAQVTELYNLIAGDIPTLVFGHSASRFVQTAMKYGSPEQRLTIARELEGRYIELAKAKYGKFLVGKILEYGYRFLLLGKD